MIFFSEKVKNLKILFEIYSIQYMRSANSIRVQQVKLFYVQNCLNRNVLNQNVFR